MPECFEVCADFVGELEDFELVGEGSAAAVVEVNADYSSDDLLGLREEFECWAYDCFVDEIVGAEEWVVDAVLFIVICWRCYVACVGSFCIWWFQWYAMFWDVAELGERIAISACNQGLDI